MAGQRKELLTLGHLAPFPGPAVFERTISSFNLAIEKIPLVHFRIIVNFIKTLWMMIMSTVFQWVYISWWSLSYLIFILLTLIPSVNDYFWLTVVFWCLAGDIPVCSTLHSSYIGKHFKNYPLGLKLLLK